MDVTSCQVVYRHRSILLYRSSGELLDLQGFRLGGLRIRSWCHLGALRHPDGHVPAGDGPLVVVRRQNCSGPRDVDDSEANLPGTIQSPRFAQLSSVHIQFEPRLTRRFLHGLERRVRGCQFLSFRERQLESNTETKLLQIHADSWTDKTAEKLAPALGWNLTPYGDATNLAASAGRLGWLFSSGHDLWEIPYPCQLLLPRPHPRQPPASFRAFRVQAPPA